MKKLIMALPLIVMAMAAPTHAADKNKKDISYEVTISVTYNAVLIEEANRIIKETMVDHQDACKTEVKARKVGTDILSADQGLYFDSGTIRPTPR